MRLRLSAPLVRRIKASTLLFGNRKTAPALVFLVLAIPLLAQKAYIPSDHAVLVVDTKTNTVIATVPTTAAVGKSIAVSPDGSRAYALIGGNQGSGVLGPLNNGAVSVIAIDGVSNEITSSVYFDTASPQSCPFAIAAHPDGKRVFVTDSCKGAVFVVDINAGSLLATVILPQSTLCCSDATGIVASPDGSTVYVAASTYPSHSSVVYAIDTSSHALAHTFPLPSVQAYGVALSPDGKTLYVGNGGGLLVVDAKTGAVTAQVAPFSVVLGVAVSTDGSIIYASSINPFPNPGTGASYTVQRIDASSNMVSSTINVPNVPIGLSLTPDGKKLYVGTANSVELVIDTEANAIITTIPGGGSGLGKFIQPSACMKATTLAHVPETDDMKRAITGRIGVGEQVLLSLASGNIAT